MVQARWHFALCWVGNRISAHNVYFSISRPISISRAPFGPGSVMFVLQTFIFFTRITERPYLYIISTQYLSKQVNAAETITRQKDKKLKEAENKINTLVSQSA